MIKTVLKFDLLLSSFFINLLGLALPLYVVQAFTRYLSGGLDETLYALTAGVILALFFEYFFKSFRLKALLYYGAKPHVNDRFFDSLRRVDFMHPLIQGTESLSEKFFQIRKKILQDDIKTKISILDFPYSFFYFLVIYWISSIASLIFFTMIIATLFISIIRIKQHKNLASGCNQEKQKTDHRQKEFLKKNQVLRLYSNYKSFLNFWKTEEKEFRNAEALVEKSHLASSDIKSLFLSATIALTVCTSAVSVVEGHMDISALIALNILIGRAFGPISSSLEIINASFSRTDSIELSELKARAPARFSDKKIDNFIGKVELRGLCHSYPGHRTALYNNFSFTFLPGSTTVVTGSNGSGKTTMFNLIAGTLAPSEGRIFFDDVNIEQIDHNWWRGQLVAVPQEPEFLHDSIYNNLLCVNSNASSIEISKALGDAGLMAFINQTEAGLDTNLNANKAKFNLGFRKRLALARASLNNGAVILMDEPTEGLDAAGAKLFYNFLNDSITKRKTVIVLSHDPAIIRGASTLINLDAKPTPFIQLGPASEKKGI